jgi:hypothetical protein
MSVKTIVILTNYAYHSEVKRCRVAKVVECIKEKISHLPVGEPFSSKLLACYGTRAALDQNLSRLVRSGEVMRVTRGVYVCPKQSKYVGAVVPEPLKIAQAKLAGEHETLQVSGAEAARQFGLTTQVPTTPVFYSSGANRRFQVGKLRVQVKRVSTRKMALAGTPAGTALSALWYVGKEHISKSVLARIEAKLSASEFESLKNVKPMMPTWMADAFYQYEKQASR